MEFNPVPALLGGLTLSLASSSLLAMQGRVLGISGIAHSVVSDRLTPGSVSTAKDQRAQSLKGKEVERDEASKEGWTLDWQASTFVGLLVGGALLGSNQGIVNTFVGGPIFSAMSVPLYRSILAGFLVGVGTKIGNGCTSGHMLCGLSRFHHRSIIATCTFFPIAMIVAQLFPLPSSPLAIPIIAQFSLPILLLLSSPALIYTLIVPRLFPKSSPLAISLSSFFIGMHFAFGLAMTGMSNPSTVLGFMYLPFKFLPMSGVRNWDPSLGMVVIGGLLPNMLAWRGIKGWTKPLMSEKWSLPTRKDVDWKLIVGSVLFGTGWGLLGLCPGPALVALGSGTAASVLVPFCTSFIAGGIVGNLL